MGMHRNATLLLFGLAYLALASAEHEEEHSPEEEAIEESGIKFGFVLGLIALAGTFIFGYILEHNHINWLPEAGVGVLMGALASGIATAGHLSIITSHEQFDFEFFMVFLLPPIIFDAGYNMDVKAFLANLGPTMFFAFIGTFASTFVVGGIVYYAGQAGYCYPLGMLASLTFGSLISATDPVTVLAVFSKLGVHVEYARPGPRRSACRRFPAAAAGTRVRSGGSGARLPCTRGLPTQAARFTRVYSHVPPPTRPAPFTSAYSHTHPNPRGRSSIHTRVSVHTCPARRGRWSCGGALVR